MLNYSVAELRINRQERTKLLPNADTRAKKSISSLGLWQAYSRL